jgi:hypothetical protein
VPQRPLGRSGEPYPSGWPSWQTLRDPLIVLTGLGLSIYEATLAQTFHPELLIFFAGIIGAPLFMRKDEKRNDGQAAPPADDQP